MTKPDSALVSRLIAMQFPEWSDLSVSAVEARGLDNRMFHLGDRMVVRLPSAEAYAAQVEKEQRWLPRLAPGLPLPIPPPIGVGRPGLGYLLPWSVYGWLEGKTLKPDRMTDLSRLAEDLAAFLKALHKADIADAPRAGAHNFHRGGPLQVYDEETRCSITVLRDEIDAPVALTLWEEAIGTSWRGDPIWIHGDVAEDNLLVNDGTLCAIIDFGCMGIGDPACDLVMAWTFFDQPSRQRFRDSLPLDEATWKRGRAWALWKALITLDQTRDANPSEADRQREILRVIFLDFQADP